jgi:hypothetical protein
VGRRGVQSRRLRGFHGLSPSVKDRVEGMAQPVPFRIGASLIPRKSLTPGRSYSRDSGPSDLLGDAFKQRIDRTFPDPLHLSRKERGPRCDIASPAGPPSLAVCE